MVLREWGKKGAGEGEFSNPHGLSLVPRGADVVVADRENSRLQLFDAPGIQAPMARREDAETTGRVFSVAADTEVRCTSASGGRTTTPGTPAC